MSEVGYKFNEDCMFLGMVEYNDFDNNVYAEYCNYGRKYLKVSIKNENKGYSLVSDGVDSWIWRRLVGEGYFGNVRFEETWIKFEKDKDMFKVFEDLVEDRDILYIIEELKKRIVREI
jgi:hypothetical protein